MDEWFIRLKREIRDLKTAHNKKSIMKAHFASFSFQEIPNGATKAVRVTYASGDQPIVTTFVATGNSTQQIIPLSVSDNHQDFFLSQTNARDWTFSASTVYFLSTRPITNIQLVSV